MKKLLYLLAFLPAFAGAQQWFASDYRWVSSVTGGFAGLDEKMEMYAEADTVIHGLACRKWAFNTTGYFRMTPRFTRSEGPAAFYYEAAVDSFVKIYDFSLPVGSVVAIPRSHVDGFTYRIDLVDTVIAGDFQLKRQRVTYIFDGQPTNWQFDILENIGMVGLLPFQVVHAECSFVLLPDYQCSSVVDGIDIRFQCFSSNAGSFHPFTNECSTLSAGDPVPPKVELWPNPVVDMLDLRVEAGRSALNAITLLDAGGRLVQTWPGATRRLNLKEMPAGVYFLELKFDTGARLTEKVVKR